MDTEANELSAREAANRLDMRIGDLYALLWEKRIRGRKVDGQWLVNSSDVEHWRRKRLARKRRQPVDLIQEPQQVPA